MPNPHDELASHRARTQSATPSAATAEEAAARQLTADASEPDELDNAATERDAAAAVRDALAAARDAQEEAPGWVAPDWVEQLAVDRMLAARDRAAAALDRQEAALDRHRAARYLADAYRDELTGVLQRDAGQDQLSHAMDRAGRSGESLVIGFLDVDHLKQVNDEQGHPAGDRLLHTVGRALRNGLRSYDLIMRYGGDEFVCALPETHIEEAGRRFAAISEALANSLEGASFSIGLVEFEPGESREEVVARADRAMYAVKRAALRRKATAAQSLAAPHD